jgi:aldose 1-epimerase
VLTPWSNRIRDAKFVFEGKEYQLKPNYPDGTAIHGVGRYHPWFVEEMTPTDILLSFRSIDFGDLNFPFAFSSRVRYWLDGKKFYISTWLKNTSSDVSMPGGFGHHPYFVRALGTADNGVSLEIPSSHYFELENALPSAAAVPIADERLDFRQLKPLVPENYADGLNDVFTGVDSSQPVRFFYPKTDTEIHMRSDDIFKHIIVYAPQDKPYFAVEPVTNTNDGFNLYARGIEGTGVFVLQQGEERTGDIKIEIVKA